MGRCSLSPRQHAISGFVNAAINLGVFIWAITEKSRFTPFYQEMQCEVPPPMPMRTSMIRWPSPMAELMGVKPANPPFGLFINMSTNTACTNPGHSPITIKAEGSSIKMLNPNLTDLAMGRAGLPYSQMGEGRTVADAHFEAGGGKGVIRSVTKIEWPLQDVLASMSAESVILGYSPVYIRNMQTVATCSTLFGLKTCLEINSDQWCGGFGGTCVAPVLDSNGVPVPASFEPATCTYTRMICGKEEDMKAQLKPQALGIEIAAQIPCPPVAGLTNETLCSVINAPGLDPVTRQARLVDPPTQLTTQAQAEKEENLASGEAMVNMMILGVMIGQVVLGLLNLSLGLFCCRRARQASRAAGADANKGSPPTILTGGSNTETKWGNSGAVV